MRSKYSDEQSYLAIVGIKNGTYTLLVSKEDLKGSNRFSIQLREQLKLKVITLVFLVYGINLIDGLNVCKYNNCASENIYKYNLW